MRKYVVELQEQLTYNVTVMAEDHDDAFDKAMLTRKYCNNDFDDNDTECIDVTEVPEDVAHEYHVDPSAEREHELLIEEKPLGCQVVNKRSGKVVAAFEELGQAHDFILMIEGDER